MTILEKIQKNIDDCNNNQGCSKKCTKEEKTNCLLVKAHQNRIAYCNEQKYPIEKW